MEDIGEKYVVFNIYIAGRHLCSRRYREFVDLHNNLKREFVGFNFPRLPGKWPFAMSEQQLDSRRRGLELYLERVCAIRVIADSDILQDFLTEHEDEISSSPYVDLKVIVLDDQLISLKCKRNSNAEEVFKLVAERIGLLPENWEFFFLFEIVDHSFERRVRPTEFPHSLYIGNYSTASATCLSLRKWLFHPRVEAELEMDPVALRIIFHQSLSQVNQGLVDAKDRLHQLKALQDAGKMREYLSLVRGMDGYGGISFPHCLSDARKEGHVVPIVAFDALRLQACGEEGDLEAQVIQFAWETITQFEVEETSNAFLFKYRRPDKPDRTVRIYSQFYIYLFECFEKIQEEIGWSSQLSAQESEIS